MDKWQEGVEVFFSVAKAILTVVAVILCLSLLNALR